MTIKPYAHGLYHLLCCWSSNWWVKHDGNRLYVCCSQCGYATAGLVIDTPPPHPARNVKSLSPVGNP